MPPPIGLIPAAGRATRLGLEKGSKEIVPVASETGSRPVIEILLDAMGWAGIDNTYVVLRDTKWDVPATLLHRQREAWPQLAYLMTPGTGSIPETVDVAHPFVRDADVVLGFPDVWFRPRPALAGLLAARARADHDVVLALFPSERPDKTDMVEVEGALVTGLRTKPGPCDLTHTWILATWGPRFTSFLHGYLDASSTHEADEAPLELQMSHVFEAALTRGISIGAHFVHDGHFIDIGTPDDMARASEIRTSEPLAKGDFA